MFKFMREAKGAISIFLVLVMLPMLTVASVFVDMSRINLAKSMAASAGDLTLNTALTNYDSELKTIYGLFATAQNMDEMMENLEDYYRRSIEAAGIEEKLAADFAAKLIGMLKEETGTSDIMNIQLSGLDVEVPQGAHLGNPAVMKSQIVEFMKYRAPLNLGMGLLDALSSMKNLSKQMDVVEDKNAFYEEHKGLLEELEAAWKDIQTYQYKDASIGFPKDSEYFKNQATKLNEKVSNLNLAVQNTVFYLYDTDNFKKMEFSLDVEYKCPECKATSAEGVKACASCEATWELDTGNHVWLAEWDGHGEKQLKANFTKDNPATLNQVLKAYNDVWKEIIELKAYDNAAFAIHEIITTCDSTLQTSNAVMPISHIYLVCELNRSVKESDSYLQSVKDLVQKLVNLNAALMTCEDAQLKTVKIKDFDTGNATINDKGEKRLWDVAKGQLSHLSKEDDYIACFNGAIERNNHFFEGYTKLIEGTKKTVKSNLESARDQAKEFSGKIDEKIGNLNSAINHMNKVLKMLRGEEGNYKSAQDTWEKSAQALGDDTMGQHDLDELKDLKGIVTEDSVSKLITRLSAAKTSLETVKSRIKDYKILDKAWVEFPDNVDHKTLVDWIKRYSKDDFATRIEYEKPTKTDNSLYYTSVIPDIQKTIIKGEIPGKDSWNKATNWNDSNNPDLAPTATGLYAWLYNNYYNPNMKYDGTSQPSQAETKSEKELNNAVGDIEKTNTPNNEGGGNTKVDGTMDEFKKYLAVENGMPSTRWEGEAQELAQGAIQASGDAMLKDEKNKGFLDAVMELAGNLGRELRDNLYISEYMMTMFTYDTIEAEVFDKENTDSDYSKDGFFEKQKDGTYKVKENYVEEAKQLKTLTNVEMSPTMNYLYGEEVEYILYGTAGKTGVYATIFAMRFALNTVYAFTDAEINNCTMAAATALFGTPPLTPLVPVAKAAMTIALALAESGWDLNELNKGKAIPLMKNKDTWVMKPTGIASQVKEEVVDITKDMANKAVDKGYELLDKALSATSEELTALIGAGTEEVNKLAQAAVDSVTSSLENYANQALQKAVELCNQVNQEFMLKTPYDKDQANTPSFGGAVKDKVKAVVERLNNWRENQPEEEALVEQVKEIAVNYLTANDGAVIQQIFESIEAQSSPNAEATDILNDKLKTISGEISIRITDATAAAGTALANLKDDMIDSLSEAAKEGADKLKATLSDKLDGCFSKIEVDDGAPHGASCGVVSSLLSWRYSDYLRIFVTAGLFINEEVMLLRTADVIERNMQHYKAQDVLTVTTVEKEYSRLFGLIKYTKQEEVNVLDEDRFTLSKSYTYVKMTAYLQVKPLLMTIPFMGETVVNDLTGTNWYQVTCESMLGY